MILKSEAQWNYKAEKEGINRARVAKIEIEKWQFIDIESVKLAKTALNVSTSWLLGETDRILKVKKYL